MAQLLTKHDVDSSHCAQNCKCVHDDSNINRKSVQTTHLGRARNKVAHATLADPPSIIHYPSAQPLSNSVGSPDRGNLCSCLCAGQREHVRYPSLDSQHGACFCTLVSMLKDEHHRGVHHPVAVGIEHKVQRHLHGVHSAWAHI